MARLLLVEDDELIARMISLRLRIRGHSVDIAVNGREGLELSSRNAYEIVLLDMHMPVMDGYEMVRLLRQRGDRGIVVAVTASAMSGEGKKAMEAGCDHYLTKPIGEDFEDRIEGFLDGRTL